MVVRHVVALVLATLFLLSMSLEGHAEQIHASTSGVGIVVAITGDVTVHSDSLTQRGVEGLALAPGDTLVVQTGGTCTGFRPDGKPFSLVGPCELRLAATPEGSVVGRVSNWVRSQLTQWIGARRNQALATRSLPSHWGQRVDVALPLVPVPDGRARASGSRLRWATIPGVDTVTIVLVSELNERTERLVSGQGLLLDDLTPGLEYVWQIRVGVGEWVAESSWRSFHVMTSDEEGSLEVALEDLGDLEAGVLLLSSGLHEEAVARLDTAVSAGTRGRSARLWRAEALADVGLYKDAHEDLLVAGGYK